MSQRKRAGKSGGAIPSGAEPANAETSAPISKSQPTPKAARARKSRPGAMPPTPPASGPAVEPASGGISGGELARTLRAIAGELERDPALAQRVAEAMRGESGSSEEANTKRASHTAPASAPAPATDDDDEDSRTEPVQIGRSFRPRIITGAAVDLGAGVPDPFALRERLGADGLRAALDELRLGTLRAIIREHNLDPTGRLKSQNDAEKLRAAILKATAKGR